MIRTKTNERLKITAINSTKDNYKLALTDLSELKHDLQDTTVDVVAQIQEGKCLSKAIIKLGPSGNYRKMSLSKIHCTASKNFVGVPDGCKKITLSGSDADSNEKLKDVVFYEK